MRRGLLALAIAGLAAAACVALIAILTSRDKGSVAGAEGPGVLEPDRGARHLSSGPQTPASPPGRPPTSGPHRAVPVTRDRTELSDDELLEALHLGNVVLAYDGRAPVAVQREVSGPFDPALAAAGQAVILDHRPGVGGVVALAWRRRLVADGPDDPRLREFAEAWLGQAPAG
ncbi:MAG TPA: DUF3105 domain-containing protein [Solirubrobacter sp.]|nr:DUF3105 domain-containing protein [Solirubrobacter sp.]